MFRLPVLLLATSLLLGVNALAAEVDDLKRQVADTERAFAKTMADRDFAAFSNFIADDAVFESNKVLHGKAAVLAAWKKLYDKPAAPFSWQPDLVEVLDSGKLALSRGPVFDPTGKLTGHFNSVWRLDAANTWHIVFDFGTDLCEAK
jgi:ketosteroid isomerase-like protein